MFINCRGNLIDLSEPKVMGIINITPDSFFEGSRKQTDKEILSSTEKMLKEGASFLDVGAYSSRPGAQDISEEEELERIIPKLKLLEQHFPEVNFSVDTFRSRVAKEAVENGAAIINDISAGNLDAQMIETVASLKVPYIMMHMKGTPQTMKDLNQYEDLTADILFYFSEKISAARKAGIKDIIIDPGFGFAKNIAQNFELLNKLDLFKNLELPFLAGLSRKSLIWKTLNSTPEDALNGTSILNTIALNKGASILRVHDVKEAMECIKLTGELNNYV
ncbi:dihydropteroate synthase [uncultured Christiangramia sp.]|uniref:dihydropteroate synthase n=1 Tax=uncultured Christiangramia sp. TaxID=503836 RepID=UPI00262E3703|nr:dihydropteroate synthase [uncultured Christiangramia sp.]